MEQYVRVKSKGSARSLKQGGQFDIFIKKKKNHILLEDTKQEHCEINSERDFIVHCSLSEREQ